MDNGMFSRLRSILPVFALSLGCVIGWGSFLLPESSFIPLAGPAGSVIGIFFSTLCALMICYNLRTLSGRYPGSDDLYSMIKSSIGKDHAFFCIWFMLLTYISILVSNVCALSILTRFFFGKIYLSDLRYTLAGCDIYFSEIMISAVIVAVIAIIASRGDALIKLIISVLAVVMLICFFLLFAVTLKHAGPVMVFSPAFSGEGILSSLGGILYIIVITPWVFVGFETVSFLKRRINDEAFNIYNVAGIALIAGGLVYMCAIFSTQGLLSLAKEAQYAAADAQKLPMLYRAGYFLGSFGRIVCVTALILAFGTSILGFLRTGAELLLVMAEDRLMPYFLAKTDKNGVPRAAVRLLLIIAVLSLFAGTNVTGWAVNVSTVSVAIVYCYISICAFRGSYPAHRTASVLAASGIAFSSIFLIILFSPSLVDIDIAAEDYLTLALWSLAGMVFYRIVLSKDREDRLGRSMVMWLIMFFVLMISTDRWMNIKTFEWLADVSDRSDIQSILTTGNLVRTLTIIIALLTLFEVFKAILQKQRLLSRKAMQAEENERAKTSLITNMSHDIRTPLNVIIAFSNLALENKDDTEKTADYLEKIKLSGKHLKSLINDVIRLTELDDDDKELHIEPVNLSVFMSEMNTMLFAGAKERHHKLTIELHEIKDEDVYFDRHRMLQTVMMLSRTIMDLTPDGTELFVKLFQLSPKNDGSALYELRLSSQELGIEKDDLLKLFGAVRNEDCEGLEDDLRYIGQDMILSKRSVEMMGGQLDYASYEDKSIEYFITLELKTTKKDAEREDAESAEKRDLSDKRALVVDDIMINRQIASALLNSYGIETEEARDGNEAVSMVKNSLPGHFDFILMDIQMPKLNGYESTVEIRELEDPVNSSVPVYAMSANVFKEDQEQADRAGMNGFFTKPLDKDVIISTLVRELP